MSAATAEQIDAALGDASLARSRRRGSARRPGGEPPGGAAPGGQSVELLVLAKPRFGRHSLKCLCRGGEDPSGSVAGVRHSAQVASTGAAGGRKVVEWTPGLQR